MENSCQAGMYHKIKKVFAWRRHYIIFLKLIGQSPVNLRLSNDKARSSSAIVGFHLTA